MAGDGRGQTNSWGLHSGVQRPQGVCEEASSLMYLSGSDMGKDCLGISKSAAKLHILFETDGIFIELGDNSLYGFAICILHNDNTIPFTISS